MSYLVSFALFGAIVVLANAVTPEYAAKVIDIKNKCAKEHNVEDSVVRDMIKNHKLPETESGKCMLACSLENMKVLVDGNINLEEMKACNAQKWDDASVVEKANGIADKCVAEVPGVGKNKCDFAYEIIDCITKQGKMAEIPFPDLYNPKPQE